MTNIEILVNQILESDEYLQELFQRLADEGIPKSEIQKVLDSIKFE